MNTILYLFVTLCPSYTATVKCAPYVVAYSDPIDLVRAVSDGVRDGGLFSIYKVACVAGNCKTNLMADNYSPKTFEEISEEAVKATDAKFCKEAKEPWQVKAFCGGGTK